MTWKAGQILVVVHLKQASTYHENTPLSNWGRLKGPADYFWSTVPYYLYSEVFSQNCPHSWYARVEPSNMHGMWPRRPWCEVKGPSDVTVITWKYMQVSLDPRRSLLTRCPREVWEREGGHILRVSTAPFSKNCSPIVWMYRLKCLQTAVSSNFVAYYFFWLTICSLRWIFYGQRFS